MQVCVLTSSLVQLFAVASGSAGGSDNRTLARGSGCDSRCNCGRSCNSVVSPKVQERVESMECEEDEGYEENIAEDSEETAGDNVGDKRRR